MELHGKHYNSKQLRQRIGNMDQVAGIRLIQLDEGNERPVRAAVFKTGTGLEFTILLDRGMDISSASFQVRPWAGAPPQVTWHPSILRRKAYVGYAIISAVC